MSNAQVGMLMLLALLAAGAAVCWFITWHERTYVRRIRHRIEPSAATMRGFVKAWNVGGCGK